MRDELNRVPKVARGSPSPCVSERHLAEKQGLCRHDPVTLPRDRSHGGGNVATDTERM